MRQSFTEYRNPDEEGFGLVGEDRVDEYDRPDRRLPMIFLTVLAMAVFAGGLWFAYIQGTRHPTVPASGDAVPLIRADDRPTKVKPDQPGGMAIPDQNVSLYSDKPGGAPVEKLLPPPEQPLPRPTAPTKDTASLETPNVPATAELPKAAPKTTPKPTATAPAKAAPTSVPGGKVQIQLASLRTPEAARDDWARLKRENADLLGKLTAVAVRTDLGDKGVYYRILAGTFGDAAAAEKLCGELKRRNLGCVIAR
jgi:hypothetical protein